MKIYVGNLSYEVTEMDLRQVFEPLGQIESVNIINDKYTGRSKGFGFVEMPGAGEGKAAIEALNGKELKGRAIVVNVARPRTENRGDRGGYGGGRGMSGRGGYGGGRGGRRGGR
ncbi:MAG: RNA-binding protein [Thermodesulfobacteriota bacterium]|nr:RNA-binding protein [Thermodesulfobacteriota bacterium]